LTVAVADRLLPAASGLNWKVTVHCDPTASEIPEQKSLPVGIVKSAVSPVTVTVFTVTGAPVPFEMVAVIVGAKSALTETFPNARGLGVSKTAPDPVPVRFKISGPPVWPVQVTLIWPVLTPAAEGAKFTLKKQEFVNEPAAGSGEAHGVDVGVVKSPTAVLPVPMAVTVTPATAFVVSLSNSNVLDTGKVALTAAVPKS